MFTFTVSGIGDGYPVEYLYNAYLVENMVMLTLFEYCMY